MRLILSLFQGILCFSLQNSYFCGKPFELTVIYLGDEFIYIEDKDNPASKEKKRNGGKQGRSCRNPGKTREK